MSESITILHLLQSCSSLQTLPQIHARMIKSQLDQSPLLASKLVAAAARLHAPTLAISILLRSPPLPDPFAHNSIINSFLHSSSSPLLSLLFFSLFPIPSPNFHTFPPLLKAAAISHSLLLGSALHASILKLSLHSHLHCHTALLSFYASCGDSLSARKLFDRSPHRNNVAVWNAIISGFVKHGQSHDALKFFRLLLLYTEPDEITFISVLAACSDLGALDIVQWIENALKRMINVKIGTALVDAFCKCGSIEDARRVFDRMSERNVMTWTVMIQGLAMFGYGEEAIALFEEMVEGGVQPDDVTFIGVFYACSHSGLVDEGRIMFDRMIRCFKIAPKMEHYGCLVDLLGRAELLEEALRLIENMPFEPTPAIWGSLLSACRKIPENLQVIEYVANHLMEIEPENDATYVLLSNIYADIDRWDGVARVRALMKERGIRKTPGCSSVEVNGTIHEFTVGDQSHPGAVEINEMLEEIDCKVRELGHVVDTTKVLLDIEEGEKKNALMLHSEKLALAFALISTTAPSSIRIMKNIRICGDCHSVMKLASKAYGREIIVRDRNRFHKFTYGNCSCLDYW
ncbi:putative tetratricopeptide-like helical domain superfamily, DYW domain-containing protein [Dioscorea sansibarensis]